MTDGKRQNEAERRDEKTDEAYMMARVTMIFSGQVQKRLRKAQKNGFSE